MSETVTFFMKDLQLLFRDRVAVLFLLLAPVVVISVAGFSLSAFYGGGEGPEFLLPITELDRTERLPPTYNTRTELTVDVTPGDNVFDFQLKSK